METRNTVFHVKQGCSILISHPGVVAPLRRRAERFYPFRIKLTALPNRLWFDVTKLVRLTVMRIINKFTEEPI
jgi:hypothetical protein